MRVFDDQGLAGATEVNARVVERRLHDDLSALDARIEVRGRGLIWGIDYAPIDASGALAKAIGRRCFDDGLLIERVGRNDTVLKVLPPLTVTPEELDEGLAIVANATKAVLDVRS